MKHYDAIIIGGSYSGLAAAMALGRALRKVLIIDYRNPCNKQTPHSHNFLTQDGSTPTEIVSKAKKQVEKYTTISFLNDIAIAGAKKDAGFKVETKGGETLSANKLIFATGIKDLLPDITGLGECWGISVLHCPYCHGYEVQNESTAIIGNGESLFDMAKLIANWTDDLTLYTNGPSTLTLEQRKSLEMHKIKTVDQAIKEIKHESGKVKGIVVSDGTIAPLKTIYIRPPFVQHCTIPKTLGCELDQEGYLVTNTFQETTVSGVYACGDNTSKMRTLANAVGSGTAAGMVVSKAIILADFQNK